MKAGALTPATRGGIRSAIDAALRSMKAGALTPATRGTYDGTPLWLRGRSMKAGALTPATPAAAPTTAQRGVSALNEGGGSHPRNARHLRRHTAVFQRSMKAGALTPATRLDACRQALAADRRSMKAGALTPATRRRRMRSRRACRSLNEGGGSHPRNAGAVVA